MRKIIYYLLMPCLAPWEVAWAQRQLPGRVTDEGGGPIEWVSVSVKGRAPEVATSRAGEFLVSAENGEVIMFRMMGYKTQELTYNGQQRMDVIMSSGVTDLEEVVVVGYGTQKRANVTGAVVSVTTEDLASRPFASTSSALQGIAPGVTVTSSSGSPGSGGTIRVRGIGTLNNSNPLVLIDGVEGDMNTLDPNIIESINVLKDAASSAIYGSRAANGVILVTTKRAKGEGLQVGYNAYTGFQSPTNLPNKVTAIDHMEKMVNLVHINSGASPLFTEGYIEEYRQNMGVDPDQYPNTDWQEVCLKSFYR